MHNRKNLLFIMNPKSGLMQAPKYMAEIIERFSGAGYLTQVLMTTGSGDAKDFAAEYGGEANIVVVSGGDGTLNGAIDGLLSGGHKTPIGYIPAGSTNDFANSIGLPKSIPACVDRIINGTPQNIDIGCFNGRYFSYVASFGAFTSTTYSVPQNIKNILGHSAYVMAGVKERHSNMQLGWQRRSLTLLSRETADKSVFYFADFPNDHRQQGWPKKAAERKRKTK